MRSKPLIPMPYTPHAFHFFLCLQIAKAPTGMTLRVLESTLGVLSTEAGCRRKLW